MSARCAQCGACCIAIRTSFDLRDLAKELARDERLLAQWDAYHAAGGIEPTEPGLEAQIQKRRETLAFLSVHWHRLTRWAARRLRPIAAAKDDPKGRYWSCDAFDPLTKQCTAHATRPPICRGYPWYGKAPLEATHRLDDECSYWHDVPRTQWPEGITPLPSPEVVA